MTSYRQGDVLVPRSDMSLSNHALLLASEYSDGKVYWWAKVASIDENVSWYTLTEETLDKFWKSKVPTFEVGKTYAVKLTDGGYGKDRYYVEEIYSTGTDDYDQYAVMRITHGDGDQSMAMKNFGVRSMYAEVSE